MPSNSKSCLITLSLSSLIFSPSASLLANEIDETKFLVGSAKEKPESIITKPLSYDMPLVNEESLTKIGNSISFSRFKPGFSKEGNKDFETSNMYISPQRYGTLKIPHTTSLVRSSSRPKKNTSKDSMTSSYPFNRTGKLYMQGTSSSGMSGCTASLIGRGILVTAAHCVVDYGEDPNGTKAKLGTLFPFKTFFVPAASSRTFTASLAALSATGPYGAWEIDDYIIATCYARGNCAEQNSSAVGANDIAILRLKKKTGTSAALPWNAGIGYYGYGWNNYGFVKNSYFKNIKSNQITQLGYPGAFGDSPSNYGGAMIRTDTLAKDMRKEGRVTNQYGSMQTGGSSGGPLIANFGKKPKITGVAREGFKHSHNTVIGVTSYGLRNVATGAREAHRQGASIFGANSTFPSNAYRDASGKNWGGGNIGAMMDVACAREHLNWKAGGYCLTAN